jgi:hypothetical protein
MVSTNAKRLGMALGCGLAMLAGATVPACAADWVPGHYGPAGRWIPGHWVGGVGPAPGPGEGPPVGVLAAGRVWVPGFFGPAGVWHPGHWR